MNRHAVWAKPWVWICTAVLSCLALAFAICESQGWPFLVMPLQTLLEYKLGRAVSLQPAKQVASGVESAVALHLWNGLELQSPVLQIDAPTWSHAPYLLLAQDVRVRMRYTDAWRAWRGQQAVVQSLLASQLTVVLERRADGRSSWQVASTTDAPAMPRVEALDIRTGQLHVDDALQALLLDAELRLTSTTPTLSATAGAPGGVLRATASGHYRTVPFSLKLSATGALPWAASAGEDSSVAFQLQARGGRAHLELEGNASDLLHFNGLNGRLTLHGPSLAAVGEPFGLTLPTTEAFEATGTVTRDGTLWGLVLHSLQVGASRLHGHFAYDTRPPKPQLSGTLAGSLLQLADLAPAVGATGKPVAARKASKVLPVRPFDLAALRTMNADVLIRLEQVDANSTLLEPLRPFHAHLQLSDGVLTLQDIDARTARGHVGGTLVLDGQQDRAHWVAALNWDGVQLARWIHQARAAGLPPYLAGQLQGHATVQGSGRSTADILATLQGDVAASIVGGQVSHLLVEIGGLDVAESLGVYLQGDKALVLDCALVDLRIAAGVMRPQIAVLDTLDSTVWVDGSLSLATEGLDLRVLVAPKDFSPLTLRAPLRISGTFAHPTVGVDKGTLGMKLGSALLLGLLNPLAALIPLVDAGSNSEAQHHAATCRDRLHAKLQRAAVSPRVQR